MTHPKFCIVFRGPKQPGKPNNARTRDKQYIVSETVVK